MAEDLQIDSEDTNPTPTSRDRWNSRYRDRGLDSGSTSPLLAHVLTELPASGRAVDLAGGDGTDACVLADHGLDTTLVEVSDVALAIAEQRAESLGVTLTLADVDLEAPGTDALATVHGFDVVHCSHYLHRPTLTAAVAAKPGWLVVSIATIENLSRNSRPGARFLLDAGELETLATGLRILHYNEDWRTNGQHEAWLVATGRHHGSI